MLSRIVVTFAGDAEPRPLPPARRRRTGDGGPVVVPALTPAAEDGRRGGAAAGPAKVTNIWNVILGVSCAMHHV